MKKADLHIAVSGFGGLNNPHPGTPVARALRDGWPGRVVVHALGYDSMMTGAWMPGMADHLHLMPSLTDGDEATFERLLEIHENHGIDAVIPCLDLEVPIYARLSDRLARAGIRTLLPSSESVYATSKLRLPLFAYEHDIRTPRTIHVLDMNDVGLHAEQFGFPLVVKGTVTGAKHVGSVEQARVEARKLHARWGGGVLLQESVAGEEFDFTAVVAADGGCLGHVAMRKLGQNPDGKGIFGAVIDDPAIEREAKRILDTLDWRGPLELEFIRPHGSDRLILLEINCRFPSWIMLSHFAGCNLVTLMMREMLEPGARRRAARPRAGTMFVRNVHETAVPLKHVTRLDRFREEQGVASVKAVKRNGHGVRVALTGIGTADVINPGLGAALALRQVPEVSSLVGLGYGAYESGIYRGDIFDAVYRLPEADDPRALLERLQAVHRESPFDVLLPSLDGEMHRFISIERDLDRLGIKTLLPSSSAFDRRSKSNLFAGDIRRKWRAFDIPTTYRADSEAAVLRAVRRLGLPVAVKGPISECIAVDSLEDARAAWRQLREKGYDEALVQPLVDGDHFAVATVCDRNHQTRDMLTIKKMLRCDRGSTWGAVPSSQPALEAAFADLLRHLRWTGPTEGEFIRDKRRERFYLIEVNPRFTAWISYSASLGVNHPYQAVCMAAGQPYTPPPIKSDLVFMRCCEELPVSPRDFAAIATKGVLKHG